MPAANYKIQAGYELAGNQAIMRYESMDFKAKRRFFSITHLRVLPGTVRLVVVWCMVACIVLFSCGWCAEEPGPGPAQVSEGDVFSSISLSVKKVQTLSAAFEQERRTTMLKEAMISRGRFLFAKPDKILWETTDPVTAGFSVRGQEVKRWQGPSGTPEKISLSEAPFLQVLIQQILAWTSADFTSLRERYDLKVISEAPATLRTCPPSGWRKGLCQSGDTGRFSRSDICHIRKNSGNEGG